MEKQVTRQQLLSRRKQLTETTCLESSRQIQQRMIESDLFSSATTLALYSPVNNEVRTRLLHDCAVEQGKQVCYPRVVGESLQFVAIDSLELLQPGSFRVAEPVSGDALDVGMIDLLVVPGVAFDREGFRLGYGKGFYDRELSRVATATVSVGLCFDFQLCDRLPVEAHDQRLDYLVTETQFIPCGKDAAG